MYRVASRLLLRLAKTWMAGETIQDALIRVQAANHRGMGGIINLLGEHSRDPRQIQANLQEYAQILLQIRQRGLNASISVKPTQIGLILSGQLHESNLEQLLKHAAGIFVWLDMESSRFTDETLEAYHRLYPRYRNLGVALQANLRRTSSDLESLIRADGKIRLVKGAYNEPASISYKTRSQTDRNYLQLMRRLFKDAEGFAIATHDSAIIQEAIRLSKPNGPSFEFQMLMGIRDEIKPQLLRENYILNEYIPYGRDWLPYSVRRMRERKRNILLLARSLLQ